MRRGITGNTKKKEIVCWILGIVVGGGIFMALFFLSNILLRQSHESQLVDRSPTEVTKETPKEGTSQICKTKSKACLTDKFNTEATLHVPNESAAKTEMIESVPEIDLSSEFPEMLPQPFEEADKRLLNEQPDWTRLHAYSMVLEFSSSGEDFLGGQPVVLTSDLLYEQVLHDFESREGQKANSVLYVQVGAVLDLASFLKQKGWRAFAREYLQSRLDYPIKLDFKIKQESIENGYSSLVCEYSGELPFEGVYRLFFREGQDIEKQRTRFLEQCALDISLKTLQQQLKNSSQSNSPALAEFLKDPSEKTLGSLLQEQGKVSIEIPDHDPFSLAMIDVQLKLPDISLRGPGSGLYKKMKGGDQMR